MSLSLESKMMRAGSISMYFIHHQHPAHHCQMNGPYVSSSPLTTQTLCSVSIWIYFNSANMLLHMLFLLTEVLFFHPSIATLPTLRLIPSPFPQFLLFYQIVNIILFQRLSLVPNTKLRPPTVHCNNAISY